MQVYERWVQGLWFSIVAVLDIPHSTTAYLDETSLQHMPLITNDTEFIQGRDTIEGILHALQVGEYKPELSDQMLT